MTEPFVRPDVRMFLQYLNNLPGPKMHELPPPAARAQMVAMKDVADLPLGTLAIERDLSIPGPAGTIAARYYDARSSREPGPLVVFYHGGGFVIGDLDTHGSFCAEMARTLDLPVVAIDYRLAPEAPWPAAPDDCEAAARWLADNAATLGLAPTGLVVVGDSAGGNLAIVTAVALRDRPARLPVIAQLPFYPATDMSQPYPSYEQFADGYLLTRDGMDWFGAQYVGEPENIRVSPILADLADMPPAVVVTASLDPIRDQGRAYAAALAKAGVPVVFREAKGQIHGFISFRKALPSAVGDVAGALAALKDVLAEVESQQAMAQAAA